METEETGSLEGWKQKRKGAWRDGNRIDRKPGGMETERPAWRNGNKIDRKPRGMETEGKGSPE